jgi:hypothetical protein
MAGNLIVPTPPSDDVEDSDAPTSKTGLPLIKVNNRQLRHVVGSCHRALLKRNAPTPTLFARGREVVYIAPEESGIQTIVPVTPAYLTHVLTNAANFKSITEQSTTSVSPPVKAISTLLAMKIDEWKLPPLVAVTETPILRPDGSIVQTAGYDEETRTVYAPGPGLVIPPIPENPTRDDIRAAIGVIDDIIGEFPFVDEASVVNTYAILLTPILRPAIAGCVPAALIDAHNPGTGKGLLTEVLALIHTGETAAMKAIPSDGDEWRKSLTSVIMAGNSLTLFDNLDTVLKSPHLAHAITAGIWTDRILGVSEEAKIPQRTFFVFTGNNIRLGGDLPRRCFWIKQDKDIPEPWIPKVPYKHPNLKRYVRENRGAILAALLTLATAWYRAGKPKGNHVTLGSFEDWSEIVGGILTFVGLGGFLGNAGKQYDEGDVSGAQWRTFLHELSNVFPDHSFTVNELLQVCGVKRATFGSGVEMTTLAELFPDEIADNKGNARTIGRVFLAKQGRYFGGYKLHKVGENRLGVAKWKVVSKQRT